LILSDEQRELVRAVEGFLEKRSPEAEVRRLMEAGGAADPAVWTQMARQLGLQGLVIPERYGGGGFGYLDLALVAECTGATLLVAPLLSTAVGASAISLSDDEQLKSTYLPALASGEFVATLALAEDSGRWDAASVTTTAEPHGAAVVLTGTKTYVLDTPSAGALVVSARSAAGVGLYVVDADAPGVTVTALDALDLIRPLGRVELEGASARRIVVEGTVSNIFDRVLAVAATLLAAEQVGGAQRCLDMAVEYTKLRVQFGRPIGSFRRSSTSAPTCCSMWSRPDRRLILRLILLIMARIRGSRHPLRRRTAPLPTVGWPRRPFRSTGGSGSPGSTRLSSITCARRARNCCLGIRRLIVSDWPNCLAFKRSE
jgi:alkylation response protein AidB-like acyl-CoA dehydrogenase